MAILLNLKDFLQPACFDSLVQNQLEYNNKMEQMQQFMRRNSVEKQEKLQNMDINTEEAK